MTSLFRHSLSFIGGSFLLHGLLAASTLTPAAFSQPVSLMTNFNGDVVGSDPAVGGAHEPSLLFPDADATIKVQASALGLTDQPVLMTLGPNASRAGLRWDFDSITTGTLQIEFEASLAQESSGIFFQAMGIGTLVRLRLLNSGRDIQVAHLCGASLSVGSITPGTPFAVRVRIFPPDGYSVTLDDERDGFFNDAEIIGSYCQTGNVQFVSLEGFKRNVRVAFDEVFIDEISIGPPPSEIIFEDGFETGNTSLWSLALP